MEFNDDREILVNMRTLLRREREDGREREREDRSRIDHRCIDELEIFAVGIQFK